MKRKQKRALVEILISGAIFLVCEGLSLSGVLPAPTDGYDWVTLCVFLVPYFCIGWRVLAKAARNIAHGQVFDENFLMALATVGALCIGEYPEAVFVMLFYRVGEWFEDLAVGRSRASIAALMQIRPDSANLERDGAVVEVSPEEVAVGDIIQVRPGEKIPLDGVILEGATTLDTVALTGESVPRDAEVGDTVISGCVNQSGLIRVQVSKVFGESTVSKILSLVENAGERKSRSEHFITRFAKYYTPSVVIAAVLLAVLPPLIIGPSDFSVWSTWIYRAMSFLVVSCPCALVISVPLSFFGGIGGASRQGILIKGSNYLEALAACDTVVFDKTGTLTEGRFAVSEILPSGDVSPDDLLRYAAGAEAYSSHPIARALREAVAQPLEEGELHPATVEEIAGHGVRATVGAVAGSSPSCLPSRQVLCGNRRLMESAGVAYAPCDRPGTVVYVALDGVYAGCLVVADRIKADAAGAMEALRACGVTRTVMLTGDGEAVAGEVARQLGISEYRAGLLPGDKVDCLESILNDSHRGRGSKVAFVGDGINDAPVLARADIGIAMGGMGSDAAIEAADVVLMDDKPSGIAKAVGIARRTLRIVRQNIVFALAVKAAVLILTALGVLGDAGMWVAVFADVGVAVLAILNAMRAMRVK